MKTYLEESRECSCFCLKKASNTLASALFFLEQVLCSVGFLCRKVRDGLGRPEVSENGSNGKL